MSDTSDNTKATSEEDIITDAERTKILEWFNKFAKGKAVCPVCQSSSWAISDRFVSPVSLTGKDRTNIGIFGRATLYPLFQLNCRVCGTTQFVNAVSTGIVPGNPKVEPGK